MRRGNRSETSGQGAISPLAAASLALVAAAAGIVLWLALGAEDTMERLRAEADRRALHVEIPLPPAEPEVAAKPGETGADGDIADASTASSEPIVETPEPTAAAVPPLAPPAPPPASESAAAAPTEAVEEPPAGTSAMPEPADGAQAVSLPMAPDPALIEDTPSGPLPRIGPDGREPWRAYARPFDAPESRPRIAIVVTDLGQTEATTETAIKALPGPVTLAFSPYASGLQDWLGQARAAGHETLLMVPMEPTSYPRNDPGPHTLLASLSPEANRERLTWVLGQAKGYVGVVNAMGSRLTTAPEALGPVLEALDARGLMFLDSRAAPESVASRIAEEIGLPHAANDRFVDDVASRNAIDLRLQELEALAREEGHAVGIVYPYPVSFERLAAWIPTLEEKGFVLAPISAIAAERQDPSG